MKKFLALLFVCFMAFSMGACGSDEEKTEITKGDEKLDVTKMAAEEIANIFIDAGFPISNVIIYTEETDTNNLLGRPNQYTSKVNFADNRVEQNQDDLENPVGGSIEVFNNAEDAQKRYEYIKEVTSGISFLTQYLYLYENVLIRIDGEVTPSDATQYEEAFKTLQSGEMPLVDVAVKEESPLKMEQQNILSVDWEVVNNNIKEQLTNAEFFSYVNDVSVKVDDNTKKITLTAVVEDAISTDTVLDFADTFLRRVNAEAVMQDSTISSGTKESYGGLYDTYSVMIGIAPASQVSNSNNWFIYDVIAESVQTKHKIKLQKPYM